jgi:hypothetical protein
MKRRTRYLFIILGLGVFLVLGPLIVSLVSGVKFDRKSNQYTRTGILSIKTDPSKATVILNDKEQETTPANLRFLNPQEYTVTLKKDGYFDWTKRADVKADKATILGNNGDKIYLLKQQPAVTTISSSVTDYAITDNYIAYLAENNIVIARGKNYENKMTIAAPIGLQNITVSEDKQLVLGYSQGRAAIVRADNGQITDASTAIENASDITITNEGWILSLHDGQLSVYDPHRSRINNSP